MQSRITNQEGIQEGSYIDIGGIRQFIQIRGQSTSNPIILFVHGGPGNPLTYLTYYHQKGLESHYTVVQWEQRGCGRTYHMNPDSNILKGTELAAQTAFEKANTNNNVEDSNALQKIVTMMQEAKGFDDIDFSHYIQLRAYTAKYMPYPGFCSNISSSGIFYMWRE